MMIVYKSFVLLSQSCFAVVENGQWRPGIGDPTFMGWLTTLAYLVATGLCAVAARRALRCQHHPNETNHAYFWGGLAALFLVLGVNKQLDIQTWIAFTGRSMAMQEGWYAARRPVQAAFIGLVALGGLVALALFFWLSRKAVLHHLLALTGAVFVAGFVIIRATSFHHVDALLGMRFGEFNMNFLLEFPGILCVIASAAHTLASKKHVESPPRQPPMPGLTKEQRELWRDPDFPFRS